MPEEEGERKEDPAPRPAPTPPAELLQIAELMAEALANSFNENSAITEQLLESLRAKPSGNGSGDVYEIFSRMLSDVSGASKSDATTAVGGKDGGGIQKKVRRWDEEEENDIARAINVCGGTGDWINIYDHLRDSGSKVAVRGKTNITRHWGYIKNEYPVIDGKIIIPTAGRAKQLRKRSEKLMVKRRQKKPPPSLPPPEQPLQPPPEQPLQLPPEQPLPLQPPPQQPLQPPPKQPLQSPPEQPLPLQPPLEKPLQPPPKQPLQSPPEDEQPLQVPLPQQQPPQQSARDAFLQAAALTLVRHEEYMKEMVRNIFEEMWKEKMEGQ